MIALPRGGATSRTAPFHSGWERGAENSDAVSVWQTPHARQAAASPLLGRGRAIRYGYHSSATIKLGLLKGAAPMDGARGMARRAEGGMPRGLADERRAECRADWLASRGHPEAIGAPFRRVHAVFPCSTVGRVRARETLRGTARKGARKAGARALIRRAPGTSAAPFSRRAFWEPWHVRWVHEGRVERTRAPGAFRAPDSGAGGLACLLLWEPTWEVPPPCSDRSPQVLRSPP
ncbi:hypothetical protein SAMN05444354_14011 [Stigmatella aurantiaca]|uniref:Uncharacterized protein n=1 Tax=Stigmatella aurantiaca TaxID=41 RepID=A0A1H8FUZ7_STIAU|nr:hypothetical protein SAMN05444354_14011 [Stigmatella aurantiaca]